MNVAQVTRFIGLPRLRPRVLRQATLCLLVSACGAQPATTQQDSSQLQSAQPSAAPRAALARVPPAIDASGSRDVTAALQAFLDSVPDGATIQFPNLARYRVEGTVVLANRRGLTLEGNGATILATTDGRGAAPSDTRAPRALARWLRTRSQLRVVGGSKLAFRNLTVRGANTAAGVGKAAYVAALEGQHGFDVLGVQGLELDRVRVTDVYGDFVYLGMRAGTWTRGVRIHDSRFERNGRQGIAITGAADVLIERNYIGQTRRSSLDLEPFSAQGGAQHVVVRDNTFGPGRLRFIAAKGKGPNVEDILVEGNTLQGRSLDSQVGASDGARRARWTIRDNVSDDTFGSPLGALMRFARVDGIQVRGNVNRLAPKRSMTGVSASESCDVIVAGNDFRGAAREAEVAPYRCRKG